jgi:ribosomal protein S18 acetylase RimI-like enzyme
MKYAAATISRATSPRITRFVRRLPISRRIIAPAATHDPCPNLLVYALPMRLDVRPVRDMRDLERFSGILTEVARWLTVRGEPLWHPDELSPVALLESYRIGEMRLGWLAHEPVAAMVLQEEYRLFWPGVPPGESLFVHKLAVVRRYGGYGLSYSMLDAGRDLARATQKAYLRLDCAADRPRLRGLYESYGFRCVGEGRVGPFDTAFYELSLAPASESPGAKPEPA